MKFNSNAYSGSDAPTKASEEKQALPFEPTTLRVIRFGHPTPSNLHIVAVPAPSPRLAAPTL